MRMGRYLLQALFFNVLIGSKSVQNGQTGGPGVSDSVS